MLNKTPPEDAIYAVDLFRPEDAQGVVRLFQAVYGDDYPVKIYYNPEKLTEANRTGDCHSVVARTADGQIVGVHHLIRSGLGDFLYEWGAGLVLPEYRSRGITESIARHLMQVVVPGLGIEEVFGEPTCAHVTMQKLCAGIGFIDTALELCLVPANLYDRTKPASERMSTLLQFHCFKPRPHTVFLPRVYEDGLRFLYSALDDERTLVPAAEVRPEAPPSELRMQIFDAAQVARIAIPHAGQDLASRLAELEREALSKDVLVLQVWLKLDNPGVAAAVDALRSRGYFLGGVLPRWFDTDGLLMQKVRCSPGFESLSLYTDRAREILQMVTKDWERACRQGFQETC